MDVSNKKIAELTDEQERKVIDAILKRYMPERVGTERVIVDSASVEADQKDLPRELPGSGQAGD
jgi:hypothetical protein